MYKQFIKFLETRHWYLLAFAFFMLVWEFFLYFSNASIEVMAWYFVGGCVLWILRVLLVK